MTVKLFNPETNSYYEITDDEYEEDKKKGKENNYKRFCELVQTIAKENKLKYEDAVRAIYLLVNPIDYDHDVRRLFEWQDSHEFIIRLLKEHN